jgi:hypothetical protein
MRRVQVIGAQRAQLLPPQRRVISQREHHPVADRLTPEHLQYPQPLGLGRDPRQLNHARDQRPGAMAAAEAPPGRIRTAADWVGIPQPLLHQEVVEQPHRHQPLLQGGIRQPGPGVDRHHVRSPAAGPGRQLPDEPGNLSAGRGHRVDPVTLTDLQVLSQPASVSVDRPGRPPQVRPDPQPLSRTLMPPQDRPFPLNPRRHHQPDPRPRQQFTATLSSRGQLPHDDTQSDST